MRKITILLILMLFVVNIIPSQAFEKVTYVVDIDNDKVLINSKYKEQGIQLSNKKTKVFYILTRNKKEIKKTGNIKSVKYDGKLKIENKKYIKYKITLKKAKKSHAIGTIKLMQKNKTQKINLRYFYGCKQ